MKGRYNGARMSTITHILPGASGLASIPVISKEAKQRLRWFDWYHQHDNNAELTCRHFGISKRTFYKWKKRYLPWHLESLESRSRRPKRFRQKEIPWQIVEIVLILRDRFPAWSKHKLSPIINNLQGLEKVLKYLSPEAREKVKSHLLSLGKEPKISVSSIGRILKDKGRINPKESQRRKKAAKQKRKRLSKDFKVSWFGDLVAFDTKHFWLSWGEKRYHYQAIDIFGKKKFSLTFSSPSSRNGKKFFLLAEKHFPFRIQNVLTDGGPEWQDEFDKLLNQKGIPHYYIYPHTPKQNSVVERSIKTDLKEFYQQGNVCADLKEQNQRLSEWNEIYEDIRPHQALDNLTPNEYYHKCQQKILLPQPLFIRCLPDLSSVYHVLDQYRVKLNKVELFKS